ncbi:hypothetical protein SESBI_02539 [Sesbania bispinosa]|nr:hypothetical protein SESBI_02539 [Sesbania bispinosa]
MADSTEITCHGSIAPQPAPKTSNRSTQQQSKKATQNISPKHRTEIEDSPGFAPHIAKRPTKYPFEWRFLTIVCILWTPHERVALFRCLQTTRRYPIHPMGHRYELDGAREQLRDERSPNRLPTISSDDPSSTKGQIDLTLEGAVSLKITESRDNKSG